ncbi:Iron transport multicopper oxidase fetC like protein [Verticillium longisporum]|nr:Iron transport multicopper oxidase fetC like protein [Verticillium longisporum]
MRFSRLALSFGLLCPALAATVTYNFTIEWVTANPDGAFNRPTIGINGQWPIPRIDANVGDRVIVHAHNELGNQSTSLHFHGLFMNNATHMDGPSMVTQCAILPGSSMTYNFTIDQPGTYWYHSHTQSQYPDGLRGPLVIHDPDSPFKDEYSEEIVLTLSDWYHEQMQVLIPRFLTKSNPTGAEPVPQAALMNETQNLALSVEPGKTYLIRVINMAAFAAQYLWFEGHNISIVEVDGIYTKPAEASMIYLAAAQRCSFLLTTRNDTSQNFPIVGSMDTDLFDQLPDDLNWNVTGWLVYDDAKDKPAPAIVDTFEPFDDMTLVPQDELERYGEPGHTVELDVVMGNLGDGANYAFFNNITYAHPKVPTLYTALTSGDLATNPQVRFTDLSKEGGTFEDAHLTEDDFPKVPMRRDTLVVWPNGNIVLRFKADNPGIWLFHCHIEWHVTSGLMATFVEAPLELQKTIAIPQDHFDVCTAGDVPVAGNAAANTQNLLDLKGQNTPPRPLPGGFTTRGIVAFVFSCIAGVLGVCVVAWYGLAGPTGGESDFQEDYDLVTSEASRALPDALARANGTETEAHGIRSA